MPSLANHVQMNRRVCACGRERAPLCVLLVYLLGAGAQIAAVSVLRY